MKMLVRFGLGLALGLAPAAAFAQELQWRAAGGPAPAGGVLPVSLSRPVPLGDPAAPTGEPWRPVVRAQTADDSKPLPPGPLLAPGGLGDLKNPTPAPISVGQDPGKTQPKLAPFVAPQPQPGTPPAATPPAPPTAVWGGPVPGATADCGNPCAACPSACPSACCGGLLGGHCLFGSGGCLSNLWSGACGGPACGDNACGSCCNRPRIWGYAEYLLWVPQNQSLPPLVTVSPAGTPLASAGVIGPSTTAVAFDRFSDPARSGMRLGGGFYFTRDALWGADFNYWFLAPWSRDFTAASTGGPIVGRPFTEIGPVGAGPAAELVAFPGLLAGSVNVHSYQNLWGLDTNLRRQLWCGPNGFLDLLLGYRHLTLTEHLDINENLTVTGAPGAVGTNILISDRFHTSNNFNAPQIGLAGQWNFAPRWYLAGSVKLAMGVNHQTVDINGTTVFNIPGVATVPQSGGLLALPTNIGSRSADRFAVLPEVGLKLGYNITPNLSVYAGYDFLYISSVVRPGAQIDPTLNSSQRPNAFGPQPLVGAARPASLFAGQDFWVQGFNFGLLYRY